MSKEIKIEKQGDPRDIYIAENNRNPEREAVEERLKEQEERGKMNLEAGWFCRKNEKAVSDKVKPMELIEGQVPVGIKFNGIEVVKPQTDFNEAEYDYGCQEEKTTTTLGEHILKEYAKDRKREEIKRDMSKYVMSDQEEKAIVEKLHLSNLKRGETSVLPGDFDGICRDLMALHARKNHDYGNAAHESYKEFGLISYVIRLNDKMKRLKTLTKPGIAQKVTSESIEDTLMDLAAYAIMAIESMRT